MDMFWGSEGCALYFKKGAEIQAGGSSREKARTTKEDIEGTVARRRGYWKDWFEEKINGALNQARW